MLAGIDRPDVHAPDAAIVDVRAEDLSEALAKLADRWRGQRRGCAGRLVRRTAGRQGDRQEQGTDARQA
jgi:hypothetical protein